MGFGMVQNTIAAVCALLLGIQSTSYAEAEAPKSDKQAEAQEFCRGKSVDALIILLGHENYHYRQCAEDYLLKLLVDAPTNQPNEIERACYKAFREHPNPEVQMRALSVLTHYATHLWSPGGFLGLAVLPLATFDDNGKVITRLKITKVLKDGPAARAGLQIDDLILSMDEVQLSGTSADKTFEHQLSQKTPGEKLKIEIKRGDKVVQTSALLGYKSRVPKRDKEGKEIKVSAQQCLSEYLTAKDPQLSKPTSASSIPNEKPLLKKP